MDDCSGVVTETTADASGRCAILVLGMHRSGTSALTRVLNLLGAALPRNILGAGPGNETGHWEPLRLVGYHDRMLADLGSRWDDWRPLDLSQIAPEKRSQIKFEISEILKEEYDQAPLFVLKEPRICRFLPLYAEIFAENRITARYVLPMRNPLAVAASLGRRDEMSEGFAALLWLRHALDAERGTRGAPRVIVSYEALMADWRPTVEALGSSIPIAWPRSLAEVQSDIGSFVDGELQHHAPSLEDLANRREIPDCAKEAYAALLALEANPNEAAALATLDGIQEMFDSAASIFGAATFPEIGAREHVFARVRQSQAEEIDALAAMAQGREEEITRLGAELLAHERTIDELNLANAGLQARIGQQNAQIGGLEVTLSAYENQYADLGGLLTKQKATENTRMTAIGTLAKKLSAQETLIGEMSGTIEQTTAAIEDLTAQLDLLRGSLSWRLTAPLRTISKRFPAVAQPSKRALTRVAAIAGAPYERAVRELHIRWNSRLILKSGLFDAAWYRDQYPDVQASGRSPVRHYLLHGALEGRDPSPFFYSRWYLTHNPDVDAKKLNPLVHYLRYGAAEGRLPKPPHTPGTPEPTEALPGPQSSPTVTDASASASAVEPLRITAAAVGAVFKKAVAVAANLTSSELTNRVRHLNRLVSYPAQAEADRASLPPLDPSHLKITWIIPDFSPGAGGHMIIFQIARYLELFGHKVDFYIQNPHVHSSPETALQTLRQHFVPFEGSCHFLDKELPKLTGDVLFATDRFTCYPAKAMAGFRRKFYFVLDYETSFYPQGSEALLTENTYAMGFDCICGGDWLSDLMRDKYGLWARPFQFGYDTSTYFSANEPRAQNRLAFYARYITPRRAVELGMLALDIVHERGIPIHVDFFGWNLGRIDVGYSYTDHGVLSTTALGQLYRKSTLGIALSATNHSLATREMMACGLPVIDLDLDSVRRVFRNDSIEFVKPDPVAIANSIGYLLRDAPRREALRQNGYRELEGISWENSARIVEAALLERLLQTGEKPRHAAS